MQGGLLLTQPAERDDFVVEALGTLASNYATATEAATLREQLERDRSERRFTAILANTDDVAMIVQEDGTISFASPSADRVLGRAPKA